MRKIDKGTGIVGHHFSNFPVPPGNTLFQYAATVGEHHRQSVFLPGKKPVMLPQPFGKFLTAFRFAQRKHRRRMSFLRQGIHRFVADADRRASGQNHAGLFLQCLQFIIQTVIFHIGHDLGIFRIISLRGSAQQIRQFPHTFLIGRL